jgi:hypothetical protein
MMMQDAMMPGSRYGVWGVNPYGPVINQPSPFDAAMRAASGVNNLFAQHYQNQIDQAKAQYNQDTLGSAIQAANTKNQADITNYPLQQAAITSQDEATIQKIQAETGLNYAQARESAARTGLIGAQTQSISNPLYGVNTIFNAYQNAAPGSPQKILYEGLLANRVGKDGMQFLSQLPVGSMGGAPQNSSATNIQNTGAVQNTVPASNVGASVSPGVGGPISTNPLGGGPRAVFHQGFMNTPNGPQTIESPTTNSATRNQLRTESHSEIQNLYPTVVDGLKPYQGPTGSASLIKDSFLSSFMPNSPTGQSATQRLNNYALANKFTAELANINARQSSGQAPGIEMNREFQKSMFPGLPGSLANFFIPGSVQASANQAYLPLQSNAVQSAIDQERQGYVQPGQQPAWAQPPVQRGFLGVPLGYQSSQNVATAPAQPQQAAQAQVRQQINRAQIMEQAQDAIRRGAPRDRVMARVQLMLQGGA